MCAAGSCKSAWASMLVAVVVVVVAVVDSDYYQGQVAPMRKEEAVVVVVVGQHYDNLEFGLHLVGGGVAVVV